MQTGSGLEKLPGGILVTTVEKLANWARKGSLWPATFGLACCAIEMMAAGAGRYDLARFGMEVSRASPRQADLMIVSGRVSQKMAPVLRTIYDQMPEPKWVISMGVCATSGGMFNNYAIVQGVDQIVPVDIYVPGCPPRPEMLIDGIMILHERIKKGDYTSGRYPFEVVVQLLHHERRQRQSVRIAAAGDPPTIPSVVAIWPGARFYEREAFDLF